MQRDALAQFVQRSEQLEGLRSEAQPREPGLRAVQRVPGMGEHRNAPQLGIPPEPLEERERGSVRQAEIQDDALVRRGT